MSGALRNDEGRVGSATPALQLAEQWRCRAKLLTPVLNAAHGSPGRSEQRARNHRTHDRGGRCKTAYRLGRVATRRACDEATRTVPPRRHMTATSIGGSATARRTTDIPSELRGGVEIAALRHGLDAERLLHAPTSHNLPSTDGDHS